MPILTHEKSQNSIFKINTKFFLIVVFFLNACVAHIWLDVPLWYTS